MAPPSTPPSAPSGATERPLLSMSLGGLVVALVIALLASLSGVGPVPRWSSLGYDLWGAHAVVAIFAFLLPMAMYLQLFFLRTLLSRGLAAKRLRVTMILLGAGALIAAVAELRFHDLWLAVGYRLGLFVVFAAMGMHMGGMMGILPKRKESVVAVDRDPLTKGDDACFTQLRFAHFFLPLGILALLFGGPWSAAAADSMARAAILAGAHLLLCGYLVLSLYGTAHLAIPRLSTVPAIAAGAIKGELHTTLLGLVGLTAGFLLRPSFPSVGRGLLGWLGFFVFIGAFTFMGVLGSNIMKNKSRTQRVTREFVYVPWTFAGVFWLMSGVLLGMLLLAAQAAADAGHLPVPFAGLRFAHIHTTLLGGAGILTLGLLTRLLPAEAGVQPPTFHAMRWPFYGINLGLMLIVAANLMTTPPSWLEPSGATLTGLALAGWFLVLRRHGRSRSDHGAA